MANEIQFNEGLPKLKLGVDKLANAVKATLGAKGRNVIIERPGDLPQITKDGVTVAKSINLVDAVENMGASLVKEVAAKTADVAGDGTTTATVLAQSIINAGYKSVGTGANPMDLKRGIDKAVPVIVAKIAELAKPVNDKKKIKEIATISANNDPSIGDIISKAFEATGRDGIISVEQSNTYQTTIEIVEGMQIERGYVSPFFVTDEAKMKAELIQPLVFLYDERLNVMRDFLPIVSKATESGRPLLIIAEEIEGEALATLVVNKMKGRIKVCAVKAPEFGSTRKLVMEDIATLTGATFVSETKGLKLENWGNGMDEKIFGSAEKIVIERDKTTIIGGHGLQIQKRCDDLKSQIAATTNDIEKDSLKRRLAKLTNGVAVIYAGAATETEIKEKKDRIDDALCATRAAAEEGYIAGGGVTFLKCIPALENVVTDNEDEKIGVNIIKSALEQPFRQILNNAGVEPGAIIRDIKQKDYGWGFNVKTDQFENLLETGVVDPAKVARVALENAASIAGLFLTTDCIISEVKEDNKYQNND